MGHQVIRIAVRLDHIAEPEVMPKFMCNCDPNPITELSIVVMRI